MFFLLFALLTSTPNDWALKVEGAIVLEETEEHQIGSVRDLAHDNSYFYVCDSRNSNVKVFHHDGRLFKVIGRSGQGPGEFQAPIAIDVNADAIFVGDPVRAMVQVFDKTSLKYKYAFRTYDIMKLKVHNEKVYITAPHAEDNTSVHVYDLKGKHLQSFGKIPQIATDHRLMASSVALAISEDEVFTAHEMAYQIDRFDHNGQHSKTIKGNHLKYLPPPAKPDKKIMSRKKLAEWMHSWSHIRRLSFWSEQSLILVSYSNPKTEGEVLDLYDMKGKPHKTGLDIEGRFLGIFKDRLICVRESDSGYELYRLQHVAHP